MNDDEMVASESPHPDGRWSTPMEDEVYVRRQLRDQADSTKERRCFFCGGEPPGLVFVPSEPGITEMGFWTHPSRAADPLATHCHATPAPSETNE